MNVAGTGADCTRGADGANTGVLAGGAVDDGDAPAAGAIAAFTAGVVAKSAAVTLAGAGVGADAAGAVVVAAAGAVLTAGDCRAAAVAALAPFLPLFAGPVAAVVVVEGAGARATGM